MALDFRAIVNLSETIGEIREDLKEIKAAVAAMPDWISLDSIALSTGLSKSGVHRQLQSGRFEEGRDFRKFSGRIYVSKAAVWQIQRQRGVNGANG